MKIRIENTVNGLFIPKRRILFIWFKIYNSNFHNEHACINWIKSVYMKRKTKCMGSTYLKISTLYEFQPYFND